MTDKSPLVTKAQRNWLRETPDIDTTSQKERTLRSRIRSRIRALIVDFPFLLNTLPIQDLEGIFEDLDNFRQYRRKVIERHATANGETVEGLTEASEAEERGRHLREGIIALLAFLYLGVDSQTDFEDWLERAISKSSMIRDERVDATVSINVERKKLSREEIRRKLREGEELDEELI